MARYLLDTNILLRVAQAEAPAHPLATHAVAELLAQGHDLCVTPQVLIEFWAVATRPVSVNGLGWPPTTVANEVDAVLVQYRLLEDAPDMFPHWSHLVRLHGVQGKRTHDARLVAVMLTHGVTRLLTLNTDDFAGFPEVEAVNPADVAGSPTAAP